MSDGGKGSAPRPYSVSNQEYAERWDAIFGKKEDKKDLKEDKSVVEYKDETTKQLP